MAMPRSRNPRLSSKSPHRSGDDPRYDSRVTAMRTPSGPRDSRCSLKSLYDDLTPLARSNPLPMM